jgi:ketosteroid isomerase-like protein
MIEREDDAEALAATDRGAHPVHADPAEELDETAQGHDVNSDESHDGNGEIDAIGRAAGLVVRDDKPFRGIEEVERRDEHRWELDPLSADIDRATD